MEKCVIDLASAIGRVDHDYITVIGFKKDNTEYQQSAEQAFSAELYHQFKQIIDADKTGYYYGLKLQFDLEKERFGGKRPDIVLHKSPTSRLDQRLFIEVKTDESLTNYNKDLKKIFDASLKSASDIKYLGFKNVAFVVGKKEINAVTKIIKKYITVQNLNNVERLNRIYLIHFTKDKQLTIKKFKELL